MSFKILATVRHFGLQNLDFIQTPNFSITNHQNEKAKIIDQDFRTMAGARTNQSFNKNYIACFIEEDRKDTDEFIAKWSVELPQRASQIETFLLFLWFVKDNCVSLEQAYGLFTVAKKFSWWTGNNLFSTCDGQFKDISFTESEINEAARLLLDYTKNCISETDLGHKSPLPGKAELEIPEFGPGIDPFKEENRIERALTFLKTARAVPHVPQKITHYMSILECLFSMKAEKIVDKVSKRTAYYLEDNDVIKKIRTAYDIRSRFVHGEKMKKSHEFICAAAIDTDDIIRRVLKKIILSDHTIFLQNNMRQYLKKLESRS